MLTRLIESRSARAKNNLGTAASTAVHVALIVSALYVTNARPLPATAPEQPDIVWARPAAPPPAVKASSRRVAPDETTKQRFTAISLSIAADIPPVELKLGAVSSDDFRDPRSVGVSSDLPLRLDGAKGDETYYAHNVDTPAAALSNGPVPEYPASLRAAGIEGNVVAQFIVDTRGSATLGSIRILSSTNDLFAESVRSAIRRMRFTPARLAGKPVPQTVQQLFVFKLSL